MARLQKIYRDEIVAKLMTSLAVTNPMQVPKITKISVNMGVGEAVADKKAMDGAVNDLTALTGQKPVVTKSRKAIAAFKLRAGVPVGARVTLRGARMYEFLDRLINVAATTRSASRNRSFSRKSPTTRSTRSAGWTSRSRRRHATTGKAGRCSNPSTSRSASRTGKMAKTSMIMREKRREKLVKQHAAKRAQLKEAIRSPKSTDTEREEAQRKLNAMPRDSSASRVRNRCAITGRSRGVYRKFGLGRQKLREATMRGDIPGLGKASW